MMRITVYLLLLKIAEADGMRDEDERCPVARLARRAMAHTDDKKLDCHFFEGGIEKYGKNVYGAWERHGSYAEILVGGALLMHGSELATSFLFLETLRQVGGPELKRSAADLFLRWSEANQALREEIPSLRAMQKALQKLEVEAKELRAALRIARADAADGIIDKKDLVKYEAQIKAEFQDVLRAASRVQAAAQPLRRVYEAFDFPAVQTTLLNAWNTVLACLATASSRQAANLGLGLGLVSDLDDLAKQPTLGALGSLFSATQKRQDDPLAHVPSPVIAQFAHGAFDTSARITAVLAAFKNQQLALTLSAVALGSRLFATGTHRLITIRRTGAPPPKLKDPDQVYIGKTVLALSVGACGLAYQIRNYPAILKAVSSTSSAAATGASLLSGSAKAVSPFRSPLRFVLTPAFALDRAIKRYSPASSSLLGASSSSAVNSKLL